MIVWEDCSSCVKQEHCEKKDQYAMVFSKVFECDCDDVIIQLHCVDAQAQVLTAEMRRYFENNRSLRSDEKHLV